MEERQHSLVSPFVLLANLGILQVTTGSHKAVNLSRESLDMVGDLQVGLEGFDVLGRLILGSKHGHRDIHLLGIVGVNHSRVALHSRLEELVVLARGQAGDLSTPAVAENGPGLETATTGGELVGFGDNVRDLGEGVWRGGLRLEEVTKLLLVVVGLRRIPRDVRRAALEEIGHKHSVFLFVRSGQDIGTLDGLVEEAEDIYRATVSVSVAAGR